MGDNKEYCKRYYYKNRDRAKEYVQRYRFSGNRLLVLERDRYTCQECFGRSGKKRLVVHHKDGNGSGVNLKYKNNSMSNLITLCSSCHARIHALENVNVRCAMMREKRWNRSKG